ncbi:protein FAM199X-B-like [Ylistrum balloti]|uniref:protein FAM199X-B-like n=1 Tax=Ylistrum balloti TaxID=509963 RepID=UPI002905DAC0|nr:protein FAM199X-B-like [Ylistrum balloti]
MMADTAVSASPWTTESILLKDFDLADFGCLDGNDHETVALNNSYDRVWKQSSLHSHQNLSTGTSAASSDCSDEHDLYLDIDADLNEHLFGDISTSLLNIIQDTDVSETIALAQDFDWQSISCDSSNTAATSEIEDNLNTSCSEGDITPTKSHSKVSSNSKCRSETFTDSIKWTCLSPEERVQVVEDLSHIVSRELGLREQMEVIRIINPSASVSPTDTEFVIELDSLNDEKLQRIRECVCRHATNQCSPDSSQEDKFTPSKKFDKKLKTRERRSRQKAIRQRQRKDYRQMLKEKRSGLFVKEEVLSLTVEDPGSLPVDDGDGDIDILG